MQTQQKKDKGNGEKGDKGGEKGAMEKLLRIVEKERGVFLAVSVSPFPFLPSILSFFLLLTPHPFYLQEKSLGLITLALHAYPRWAIRRLTETYVSLSFADVIDYVGFEGGEEEVRGVVVGMVRSIYVPLLSSITRLTRDGM